MSRLMPAGMLLIALGTTAPGQAADLPFTPYAALRWRLETVDQDDKVLTATAATVRLRAGLKTKAWNGLSALVEGEAIARVGPNEFNSTTNGLTQFPTVADPSDVLLNQAVVRWDDAKIGSASVGRQTVNLDNQRWVGSVDWRQNDQTFDIARVEYKPVKGVSLSYGYAWRVNRVFGPGSAQGIWRDNNINLLRASADIKGLGTVSSYGYLLDMPDAPLLSSKSFGVRLVGKQVLGKKLAVIYAAEFARQSEHGANPRDFALSYLLVEPGIVAGPVTTKLGFEKLGGNGVAALQTPLATLFAFNGWADKFLTTPADGLRDIYLDAAVVVQGFTLRGIVHDYRSDRGNRAYGREVNLHVSRPIGKKVTVMARFAAYEARGFAVDTTKFWLQAEAKF